LTALYNNLTLVKKLDRAWGRQEKPWKKQI